MCRGLNITFSIFNVQFYWVGSELEWMVPDFAQEITEIDSIFFDYFKICRCDISFLPSFFFIWHKRWSEGIATAFLLYFVEVIFLVVFFYWVLLVFFLRSGLWSVPHRAGAIKVLTVGKTVVTRRHIGPLLPATFFSKKKIFFFWLRIRIGSAISPRSFAPSFSFFFFVLFFNFFFFGNEGVRFFTDFHSFRLVLFCCFFFCYPVPPDLCRFRPPPFFFFLSTQKKRKKKKEIKKGQDSKYP